MPRDVLQRIMEELDPLDKCCAAVALKPLKRAIELCGALAAPPREVVMELLSELLAHSGSHLPVESLVTTCAQRVVMTALFAAQNGDIAAALHILGLAPPRDRFTDMDRTALWAELKVKTDTERPDLGLATFTLHNAGALMVDAVAVLRAYDKSDAEGRAALDALLLHHLGN